MTDPAIAKARETLRTCEEWLAKLEGQIAEVQMLGDQAAKRREAFETEQAQQQERLRVLSEAQVAEHAKRQREIDWATASLEVRERELAQERERIIAREAWVESRAADLSARLHNTAA